MSRVNVRGSGTADKLIEVAENLFGLRGVEAVSLREIAQAAGSSNKFAVQYYFGSKEGLIQAIFAYRLPALDKRRGEFLEVLKSEGQTADIAALLGALLRPVCEQRDAQGRRSYAAFLSRLWGFTAKVDLRTKNNDLTPNTGELFSLLRAASPIVDRRQFEIRMILIVSFFLNSLTDYERAPMEGYRIPLSDQEIIDDILAMSVSAFLTPLPSGGEAGLWPGPCVDENSEVVDPRTLVTCLQEGDENSRPPRLKRNAPEQKVRLALETLQGKTGVAAIASREAVSEGGLAEGGDQSNEVGYRQLASPTRAHTSRIAFEELLLRAQMLEKIVVDQALEIQFLKSARSD